MHGLNFLDPIPRRVRLGFTLRFVPEQTLRRLHGNRKLQRLKRFTTNRSLRFTHQKKHVLAHDHKPGDDDFIPYRFTRSERLHKKCRVADRKNDSRQLQPKIEKLECRV
jgi:hypothetical protein